MQFHYKNVLRNTIYLSVCRTITVSVQPVCPIELQGKILLHISVHCPTAKQLIPHLSERNLQTLIRYFQIARQRI